MHRRILPFHTEHLPATEIAAAMFNVAGPLADPAIVYIPGESFKGGLSGQAQLAFNVLKDTLKRPEESLVGSTEDSQSLPLK